MSLSSLRIPDPLLILISRLYVMFLSYIQLNVFLILIGTSDYGKFVIIQSGLTYTILLGGLGLNLATTRNISYVTEQEEKIDFAKASFILTLLSSIFVATLFFFFSEVISTGIYNDSSLTSYFHLVGLGIIPAILTESIVGMLRGLQKMQSISKILVVSKTFGFSISMLFVILYGLVGLILGLFTFHLFGLTTSSIFFLKSINIRKITRKKIAFRKYIILLKFSMPYYILGLMHQITFLLGYAYVDVIAGHDQIAFYSIAYFPFTVLVTISTSISYVIFPRISKGEGIMNNNNQAFNIDNSEGLVKLIQTYVRYSFFLLFTSSFLLIGFRPFVLSLFVNGYKVESIYLLLVSSVAIVAGLGNVLVDGVLWGLSRFRTLLLIRITYIILYFMVILSFTEEYGSVVLASAMILGWIGNIIISYLGISFFFLKQPLLTSPLFLKWNDWLLIVPSYIILYFVLNTYPFFLQFIIILVIVVISVFYFSKRVATPKHRNIFQTVVINAVKSKLNFIRR